MPASARSSTSCGWLVTSCSASSREMRCWRWALVVTDRLRPAEMWRKSTHTVENRHSGGGNEPSRAQPEQEREEAAGGVHPVVPLLDGARPWAVHHRRRHLVAPMRRHAVEEEGVAASRLHDLVGDDPALEDL